jgi:hypothetical protein
MVSRRALAGVGVYALSEDGHRRIFPLPDVLSDDGLVHRRFAAEERIVVVEATAVVRPARTLRAHLHRRVRVRQGNRELGALGLRAPEGRLRLRSLGWLVADRLVSPLDAASYLGVLALDRVRTLWRGTSITWSTDTSSRGSFS